MLRQIVRPMQRRGSITVGSDLMSFRTPSGSDEKASANGAGGASATNVGSSARPLFAAEPQKWDVDFSLALFNRTGKFHIGKLLLEHCGGLVDKVRYWRVPLRRPPRKPLARIIRWLGAREHSWVLRGGHVPPRRRTRPMVHLDPHTVLSDLSPEDIVLCHDIGPITHPHLFPKRAVSGYKLALARIAEVRPNLVFVSEASRRVFIEHYGEGRLMKVIYPPLRLGAGERWDEAAAPADVERPFLLTVGSIGDRKNQRLAIEAFRRSGLAERGFEYVLCGPREPGYEGVAEAAASCPGVRMRSFVSETELRWLYREARAFVLPSLLEGFGMPVAEAMQHGLVPIVSRDTVLEEVAGKICLPVDPLDPDDIAAAMVRAVDMERLSSKTIARQLGKFTEAAFVTAWRDLLAAPRPSMRASEAGAGSRSAVPAAW